MKTSISGVRKFSALMSLAAAFLLLAAILFLMGRTGESVQAAQPASADSPSLADKVIVVNLTGTVNIIDTATDIVYGPFLSGTLGSTGGGTFDVAVTPDGNTALISNFGDSTVYFVDVSDPFAPSFIISVTLPMFAEDIAISPDGKYALVTDGGFSPVIAVLDLISPSLVSTITLENHYSNAVAIAPNRTVVTADYFLGEINTLVLDDAGVLSYTGSYSYTIGPDGTVTDTFGARVQLAGSLRAPDRAARVSPESPQAVYTSTRMSPVNIAIAPDGQTVLVSNVTPYTSTETSALFHMGVYRITGPGVLSFRLPVTRLSRAVQSVAFSPDGKKAYLAGNGIVNGNDPSQDFNQLAVLDIVAPGEVHLAVNNVADYPRLTSSQLFGVDSIAYANGKLYLGYPTISGGSSVLRIINVDDFSVFKRQVDGIPSGMGVIPGINPAPPAADSPSLAEKVIVVNLTGTVNIIDTATDIVYGPFLSGTLGSTGGGTFDVAVTPDGNTALISNFGDSTVYFVDVSDPFAPSFIISVTLPMFAEDIAISPDGKYALVTDGGFSPVIAVLDLISPSLVSTITLENHYSNAVAIAPNRTVVTADYFLGEINTLVLDDQGKLTYSRSYSYTIDGDGIVSVGTKAQLAGSLRAPDRAARVSPESPQAVYTSTRMSPVNIAIAPDGQTVLVSNVIPYTSTETSALFHMGVYRITGPGVLSFRLPVTRLSRAVQSVAFSPDGKKVYLAGNGIVNGNDPSQDFNQLAVLDIVAPGEVHLAVNNVADYPRLTSSQLFGVDTIAYANGKLYLGYPVYSGGSSVLRIVNVDDFSVFKRQMSGIPMGMGVIPVKKSYLPLVVK